MNLEIRECSTQELPGILQRLDHEFVYNKRRSLSLSKRFPNILSPANMKHVLVALSNGEIRACCVIKAFNWFVEQRVWHGAMVGMVWVDLQYRRAGIGRNLLSSATRLLTKKGLDFGVLWTGMPEFYEQAGWHSNDNGLFGEATKRPLFSTGGINCRPLISMDTAMLEELRTNAIHMRVQRSRMDYHCIPIPADQVLCFHTENKNALDGFALVGEKNRVGYFYEMVAPPDLWHRIWTAITQCFAHLFVNGCEGDPFAQWLTVNRFVLWRPQDKTMWLPISERLEDISVDDWHISYFDRI